MPQAKLPDINNAWVRYRNYGIDCIEKGNYAGAISSVLRSIALFPEKYQIEINTEKFNQIKEDKLYAYCKNCNTEHLYNNIKILKIMQPLMANFLSGNNTEKVWYCQNTECNTINKLKNTKLIQNKNKTPSYHGVIPEPPRRQEGMFDRHHFHNRMITWFNLAGTEIDHMIGKYRAEYRPEGEEDNDIIPGDEDAD